MEKSPTDWGIALIAAAAVGLVGTLLLIAAVSPMNPVQLWLYGLAFAGGVLALGLVLLVLFMLFLLLLGTRRPF